MFLNKLPHCCWQWSGIDTSGLQRSGIIAASTRASAHQWLVNDNIAPLKLKRYLSIRIPRCSALQLTLWLEHLHRLTAAAIALPQALALLQHTLTAKGHMLLTQHIRDAVAQGLRLSTALNHSPFTTFPSLDMAWLEAAERASALQDGLKRLVEQRQRQHQWARRCQQQLRYPLLLLVAGLGTLWLMMTMVIPGFAQLYSQSGQPLPLLTRGLIQLADGIAAAGVPLSIGTLVASGCVWRWRHHARLVSMAAYIPIAAHLRRHRLAMALLECLSLSRTGTPYSPPGTACDLDRLLQKVRHEQMNGAPMSRIAAGCRSGRYALFPEDIVHLMTLAEHTGQIDALMHTACQLLEDHLARYLERLTVWLEPALLAAMGTLVGLLMVSLYLPLLEMKELIT